MTTRTALLVGATGLIGGRCLERLLVELRWSRVVVLARRPTGVVHHKLVEVIVDLERMGERRSELAADDVLCCLGTTIKRAGSQEAFRKVDHDLALEALRLAREGGAMKAALVSSVGADASSRNFYLRTKGETERDAAALGFEQLEVMRPSLLLGQRAEHRAGEAIGMAVLPRVSWMLVGGLRSYRPIEGDTVAAAMVAALKREAPGVHVRHFDALLNLAGSG